MVYNSQRRDILQSFTFKKCLFLGAFVSKDPWIIKLIWSLCMSEKHNMFLASAQLKWRWNVIQDQICVITKAIPSIAQYNMVNHRLHVWCGVHMLASTAPERDCVRLCHAAASPQPTDGGGAAAAGRESRPGAGRPTGRGNFIFPLFVCKWLCLF